MDNPETAALFGAESRSLLSLRDRPRVLWLLDYDGTLVPFRARPELAAPDRQLLDLLGGLARLFPGLVHIVSGRPREVLESWLGAMQIGLHAEHGLWSRGEGGWVLNKSPTVGWMASIRPVLQAFAKATAGAFVEEKSASLVWHYREADPAYGELQARELKSQLAAMLQHEALELLAGHKVVEVKLQGVNKGLIATTLLSTPHDEVVAMGDDETDESMFRALPSEARTFCVGERRTSARYRLSDVGAARSMIEQVVKSGLL